MRELAFANRHPRMRADLRLLRQIALTALADPVFGQRIARRGTSRHSPSPAAPPAGRLRFELAFFLVDAERIAALNAQHLRHAGATDVISFDYGGPPGVPSDEPWLRGDVFICLDVARVQARRFRTSWPAEMVRYLVHGLLHLRGFDDQSPAARRAMKREEDRLVRQLQARFALRQLARAPQRAPRTAGR